MFQINGSIASHLGKVLLAYRTQHLFNYDSQSFLTELDENFEPITDIPLVAENGNTAFEDVRLFSFGKKLLAFYSYFPFENSKWQWHYGIGYGEVDLSTGLIKKQISLRNLSKRNHEKNWSPYAYRDELFLVTDFDPFLRIIKINNVGELDGAQEYYFSTIQTVGWSYGELRGGTPLIENPDPDDNWLYGFIHSYLSNNRGFGRYYYYTVVRFDHLQKKFEYSAEPLPCPQVDADEEFDLLWDLSNGKQLSVVFPMGVIHHNNGLMVSFGKDDVSSYVEHFSWEYLKGFFKKSEKICSEYD